MNSMSIGSPNGSPSSRSKRYLTEKLSSYFSSKSAHINAFSIELDEPHRRYGPGDTVSGTVVLNVGRPLGITHVVVCLYGYVEVFKNHASTSIRRRHNAGRIVKGSSKRWVSEYYGDGFASLFEEEVVLCGEGRLDPKLYHFRFEIDFPSNLDLPTSIDFERGTITYMITSTITRPSSITAPTTCESLIYFKDSINVGALPPPKAQKVTLRAIESPSRPKGLKRLTSSDKTREPRGGNTFKANQSARSSASRDHSEASRQQSLSSPSSRSSSGSRRLSPSITSDFRSSQYSRTSRTDLEFNPKNITASVQLSTSGCLPGEVVPLVVTVNHTKAIRSLHGVVVTLYRQARVDMHPNLPVIGHGGRSGYEDYYPRSKTGLGGLSLSAAGSSQAWRKDLSQTFAPVYIDPTTMSTDVKVAIRVPDEAFPTIRNVPGDMISFKYFVEVIIDIHGKLNSSDRSRTLNISAPQSSYATSPSAHPTESGDPMVSAWGSNCVDTLAMRRDKNAVSVTCDLVVGTLDSGKSRGKRPAIMTRASSLEALDVVPDTVHERQDGVSPITEIPVESVAHDALDVEARQEYDESSGYWDYDGHWYPHDAGYVAEEHEQYDYGYGHGWEQGYAYAFGHMNGYRPPFPYPPEADPNASALHFYPAIPPPPSEQENGLSEKERLRRAEATLLPSEPPGAEGGVLGDTEGTPTAPHIPEEAFLAMQAQYRDAAGTEDSVDHQETASTAPPSRPTYHQAQSASEGMAGAQSVSDADGQQAPVSPLLSPEDEDMIRGTRRMNVNGNDTHPTSASGTNDTLPRYRR